MTEMVGLRVHGDYIPPYPRLLYPAAHAPHPLSFRGSVSDRRIPWLVCTGSDDVPRCPCVVAKYARFRFRLTAKASPAPLLLLFRRDPLRRVRVRDEGWGFRGLRPPNDGEPDFLHPRLFHITTWHRFCSQSGRFGQIHKKIQIQLLQIYHEINKQIY